MALRISVDTGGTFTDVVVADEEGNLRIGKGLTSTKRAFEGILAGLAQVADELGSTPAALLADAEVFTYGTTRATNAIVEHKTAKTAFFTTEGFPDILLLREGGKLDPFKQIPYQPPYVPRRLTYELHERIDSEGEVYIPLDEASVIDAIDRARLAGVEAIAVCLIWSIVNAAHELRVGELIAKHLPGLPFTLSHQLNPVIREYRRSSSAAIDASLKPLMQDYLQTMERDLREAGFAGHLFITTSFGGAWRPEEVVERPIYSIGSGPSMAPVAALTYGKLELSEAEASELLVCDTGGTTFDVGLVTGGEVGFANETWIGGRWVGHITGVRSVDVKSIGAGGGSIAWVDAGGLLRVGPESAGSDPGPACYGRGGTRATVTDAAVVLGYVDPTYFLGGRMTLDAAAARTAVGRDVAEPLKMSLEEAAAAILVIANENIVGAIRELTIARGIDPREVTLVAGGGAAGLNIAPIARELGSKRVLIPATAGALSACGALYADFVSEFSTSTYAETRNLDAEAVNGALAAAEARADRFLGSLGDVDLTGSRKDFFVEARYRSQVWELDVPLARPRITGPADVTALEEAFHQVHQKVFAVHEPGQYVECLVWKTRATAVAKKPPVRARAALVAGDGSASTPPPIAIEPAYFRETGSVPTPRYDGELLPAGSVIAGPAVIREKTTTVVVYPGTTATVTSLGNYSLEIQA